MKSHRTADFMKKSKWNIDIEINYDIENNKGKKEKKLFLLIPDIKENSDIDLQ